MKQLHWREGNGLTEFGKLLLLKRTKYYNLLGKAPKVVINNNVIVVFRVDSVWSY